MKKKRIIGKFTYHICMIVFCVLMSYPLLWMISSSFKSSDEIMRTSDQLLVLKPTLENYINGWKGFGKNTFTVFFRNSLVIAFVRVLGTVISSSLTAFGFARMRFPGRKILFAIMIGTMCLPGMVLQIPQFILFNKMGWVGSLKPLLIPCWFGGGAFYVFLLMQFMKNIPREIDEAAIIDGCSWFGLYRHIMLPLIKPSLCSVGILTFIEAWGDFYSALIYLNKPELYPVAYALKLYSDEVGINYGPMIAMSVLSLIPVLILFFIFQKSLVEGISTTGLKG